MTETTTRLAPVEIGIMLALKSGELDPRSLPPATRRALYDFPFSEPVQEPTEEPMQKGIATT